MKRPILLRKRLQHCVWMLAAATAAVACGQTERGTSAREGSHELGSDEDMGVRERPAAVEDGGYVRGDDRTDAQHVQGPEDALSPPMSASEEAALSAQIAADVAAIADLHFVAVSGATRACDESSCVYACDETCLDVDPRVQAERVNTLRTLAEEAVAVIEERGVTDDDWTDPGAAARLEEDLVALRGLAVLDGLRFADAADEECPGCYGFMVPAYNASRRLAVHLLAETAVLELSPPESE